MYLGVEIGGTKLQVGVCDRRGRLRTLERRSVERERGARGILRQLEKIVPSVLTRYDVKAIGVGFGGPFDVERGRAVTSHQIAGWDGFPVKQWFERRFSSCRRLWTMTRTAPVWQRQHAGRAGESEPYCT